jgi:hypothetical protein
VAILRLCGLRFRSSAGDDEPLPAALGGPVGDEVVIRSLCGLRRPEPVGWRVYAFDAAVDASAG